MVYEGIEGKWNSHTSSWTHLQKNFPIKSFDLEIICSVNFLENLSPKDCSARIDIGQLHSPILLLGSTVDEIWDASSAIDDIVSHYKGHHITFKKYHETGHMLTVAYQPNHRYRKDWRLLLKESKDSWLATIHFFDRHLKKRCYKSYGKDIKKVIHSPLMGSYSERFCSVLPAIKIESQFVFFLLGN